METRHIRAIDGLRALAVTLVLLYHSEVFAFGWVGVWVFFVISGFVIASSLMSSEAGKRPLKTSLLDFYSKRAFRILPLYIPVVLAGAIVNAQTHQLGDEYWPELLSLSTFNFNFMRMWSQFVHTPLSGHLWSLSVEEQFYVIFPLVFLLTPRRHLGKVLVGVAIAAVGLRVGVSAIYGQLHSHNAELTDSNFRGGAVYQFSPGHFDAFAIGALMALGRKFIERTRGLFTLLLFATVAGWTLFLDIAEDGTAFVGHWQDAMLVSAYGGGVEIWRYSLLVLTSATAIVGILRNVAWIRRPLELSPVVYVGKISYGIYLFHFPMLWFIGYHFQKYMSHNPVVGAWESFFAILLGSIAVASATYHFYERPIARLRPKARVAAPAPVGLQAA